MTDMTFSNPVDALSALVAEEGYFFDAHWTSVLKAVAVECGHRGHVAVWVKDDEAAGMFWIGCWVEGWLWRNCEGQWCDGVRASTIEGHQNLSEDELSAAIRSELRARVRAGLGIKRVAKFKRRPR